VDNESSWPHGNRRNAELKPSSTSGRYNCPAMVLMAAAEALLIICIAGCTTGIQHPAYDDAAQGVVRPRGGHNDPALHNGGDNRSVFTSWSSDERIVRDFASEENGPGVVQRIPNTDGPGYSRVPSPDVYGEAEVLVRGPVLNAEVLP
jgi:hypothetical protein